jgi:hypothetical protein
MTRPLGLPGLFIGAARRAGVADETEAALVQIERRLENVSDAQEQAWKVFRGDLALCLRTGRMDDARIRMDAASVEREVAKSNQEQYQAFRALHDLLTDAQRRSIVEAMRASVGRPSTQGGRFGGSRQVDSSPVEQSRMLVSLKAALQLDEHQEQLLAHDLAVLDKPLSPEAALARGEASQKQMASLLDAFGSEDFGAVPLDLTPVGPSTAGSLNREAKLVQYLLPVLRSEQAEEYARSLSSG